MTIWMKIAAFASTVAGFFMLKSKLQAHEIENLEEENHHKEEIIDISEKMQKATDEAEQAVKDEKDSNDGSDWKSSI